MIDKTRHAVIEQHASQPPTIVAVFARLADAQEYAENASPGFHREVGTHPLIERRAAE